MKAAILSTIALLAVISGFMVYSGLKSHTKFSLAEMTRYQSWRARFNKLYSTPSENQYRINLVINKMRLVDQWNQEYNQYLKDSNLPPLTAPMFASMGWDDLSAEEFRKLKTGLRADLNKADEVPAGLGYELPAEPESNLGQTATSYIHYIRNQGECGSCWAFSTAATLERHYFSIKKIQVQFSQQELVDCSQEDYGCDGGWPTNTYYYIWNYGIQSYSSYPYYGNQYYCERDETKRIWFDNSYMPKEVAFTQTAALNAAAKGIVAGTAVYSGGKFNNLGPSPDIYNAAGSGECSIEVDHAVNIQSSGKDANGKMFAAIQNSWGEDWGVKGVKKIYPCGTSKLWGATNIIQYTTNVAI